MAIYSRKSINGSVKWLGVPAPFCDIGATWTENILVPSPRWGYGVRVEHWAWGTQHGVFIGAAVLWSSVVPDRPFYLPIIPPENVRATASCVRDDLLREHCLERAQNVLYAHHISSNRRVNRLADDWDDLWDEPDDQ